jgi:hypothetical protein
MEMEKRGKIPMGSKVPIVFEVVQSMNYVPKHSSNFKDNFKGELRFRPIFKGIPRFVGMFPDRLERKLKGGKLVFLSKGTID